MTLNKLLLWPFFAFFVVSAVAQTPCEKLRDIHLQDATITAAELIPAGPLVLPGPASKISQNLVIPAYCRVALLLTPSSDSHIESEVWLPVDNWNGKFQVVGNGGWAGIISYPAMAAALKEGYATASTDTGHKANEGGGNGMFALGHPEKIVDFGYRALHETTVIAKTLINASYKTGPKYSYYNGCSTGGRQGLMEVTRYPEDFDGAVVGAPANPHLYLHSADIERNMRLRKDPGHTLTQAKVATLHKAVLAACDGLDGAKDGLIGNPEKCGFDPASLLCRGTDSDSCLTAAQVEAAEIIYGDIRTRKGEIVWTGFPFGGELQYAALAEKIDPNASPSAFPLDSIRILGYQDPNWDWRSWNLDRDLAQAKEKAGQIDVHTRDFSAFKARGGKLLLYHGWADPGISAGNTVNIYKGILSKMGEKQENWLRLFMVPGMGHCSGGAGTDQFNKMAVLERWRETGVAPDKILASHVTENAVDRTRPLCPYPKVATYRGSGSVNDAENFVCK